MLAGLVGAEARLGAASGTEPLSILPLAHPPPPRRVAEFWRSWRLGLAVLSPFFFWLTLVSPDEGWQGR